MTAEIPFIIIKVFIDRFSDFFSSVVNWCQHWFEYFPNPPINILSMIENVLAFHDKELLQHFIDRDITSQVRNRGVTFIVRAEIDSGTDKILFPQ